MQTKTGAAEAVVAFRAGKENCSGPTELIHFDYPCSKVFAQLGGKLNEGLKAEKAVGVSGTRLRVFGELDCDFKPSMFLYIKTCILSKEKCWILSFTSSFSHFKLEFSAELCFSFSP